MTSNTPDAQPTAAPARAPLPPLPAAEAVIVGAGARAPNGLTALQVTMSVRALKMDPRASHLIDRAGEPMVTCRLPSIGDHVMGLDRLVALGGPALTQAAFPWLSAERQRRRAARPLPVVVALPPRSRPGFDPRLESQILAGLEARSQVPIDHARSALVLGCRGGAAQAFEIALQRLGSGEHDAVAVGGVDSFFDPDALEWLDRELRLHSMRTENGFIPGEGAAFVVLAARGRAGSLPRLGQVLGVAVAAEPRPYGSDEPCLAAGITSAVKRAAAAVGAKARRIPWVMNDVVNERHRVDEWSYVMARAFESFTPDVICEQPLLKTGDLGAASAPLMLAMATVRWGTRCAPGDCVLIGAHAEGPERGALLASLDPVR
ncbi:beta-ketoacyl synthase N-terminal-like domain-containing protein [Sorangium sp. So ce448]|uniref:beta-ketoacyl synthase N-terminal-like domain-containing protein n=1 Tax=Sorangium sp. So ce448 TaxID=3133314 RepID=UPI003F5DB377